MRNLLIIFAFIFTLTLSAQESQEAEKAVEVVEVVVEQETQVARLHLNKDWRIQKELKFETKIITKLC